MARRIQFLLMCENCRSVCSGEYSSALGNMLGRSNMPGQVAASDSGCISTAQAHALAGKACYNSAGCAQACLLLSTRFCAATKHVGRKSAALTSSGPSIP